MGLWFQQLSSSPFFKFFKNLFIYFAFLVFIVLNSFVYFIFYFLLHFCLSWFCFSGGFLGAKALNLTWGVFIFYLNRLILQVWPHLFCSSVSVYESTSPGGFSHDALRLWTPELLRVRLRRAIGTKHTNIKQTLIWLILMFFLWVWAAVTHLSSPPLTLSCSVSSSWSSRWCCSVSQVWAR